RADAAACGQGGAQPLLVVITGRTVQQLSIQGPGARSWPVPVIDENGVEGQRWVAHAKLPAVCWRTTRRWKKRGKRDGPGDGRPVKRPGSPLFLFPSVFSRTA